MADAAAILARLDAALSELAAPLSKLAAVQHE
jgi:hypothetical protein